LFHILAEVSKAESVFASLAVVSARVGHTLLRFGIIIEVNNEVTVIIVPVANSTSFVAYDCGAARGVEEGLDVLNNG
jgi:hypothetical protein